MTRRRLHLLSAAAILSLFLAAGWLAGRGGAPQAAHDGPQAAVPPAAVPSASAGAQTSREPATPSAVAAAPSSGAAQPRAAKLAPPARRDEETTEAYERRLFWATRYAEFVAAANLTPAEEGALRQVLADLQSNMDSLQRVENEDSMEIFRARDPEKVAMIRKTHADAEKALVAETRRRLDEVLTDRQLQLLDIHYGVESLGTYAIAQLFSDDYLGTPAR